MTWVKFVPDNGSRAWLRNILEISFASPLTPEILIGFLIGSLIGFLIGFLIDFLFET